MPLVIIGRDPDRVDDGVVKKLVGNLPEFVAGALTAPHTKGGELTAQDIEVWVKDFGPHDVNSKELEIVIFANLFPERWESLDFSRAVICNAVRSLLPEEVKGFVWVLLQPGSFGEF